MHVVLSLTVSESKRLIARGVLKDDRVVGALASGKVAVVPGTTNAYIVEELMARLPDAKWTEAIGDEFNRLHFVAGRTLPTGYSGPKLTNTIPAIVIHNGLARLSTAREAAEEMEAGDVFIKGVNAINYDRNQAGVLIGHPKGGNVDEAIGPVVARRVCFLHPAGFEKQVSTDLNVASEMMSADAGGKGATLWVVPGPLFTEIEAIQILSGARAVPVSAGGVGGAEGAVWFSIFGNDQQLAKAKAVVDEVLGEPPYTGVVL